MAGMTRFDWADPFLFDEQLSDDERMIRDTAKAYARDTVSYTHLTLPTKA